MRKGLLVVFVVGALMLAPGLVTAAHAGHSWLAVGAGFRIGPALISVVLAPSGYDYLYFYRFDRPLHHSRGGCGPDCFVEDGYYYYPSACPLVTTYFDRYGVDPYQVYERYAPRYHGRGYDGYRSYGYYGYHDGRRYDRYDDHRGYRDRGYDNHNRYDRDRDRRFDDHRGRRDGDRRYDRYDDHRGSYRDRGYDNHNRYDRDHDRRFDDHRDRRDDGRSRHDRDNHRRHR
jgi:hypothetical protein